MKKTLKNKITLRPRGRKVDFDVLGKLETILDTSSYRRDHLIEYLHKIQDSQGAITKNYMTRGSAKVGDKIAVTGNLGDSLGGLKLLNNNKKNAYLSEKHLIPKPKINESHSLVTSGIKCCMDISDGLHNDLINICL